MKPKFHNAAKFILFATIIGIYGCSKEVEDLSGTHLSGEPAKSAETLSSELASTQQMREIEIIYNQLMQESLTEDYALYLGFTSELNSEEEVLQYYSEIFVDEVGVFEQVQRLQELYLSLFSDFPELQRMTDSELIITFQDAHDNLHNDDAPIMSCTDPDCAESVAIGAAFCLPSLALAGWGYFVCAAGVAISAMHCCYG
jgi:hypothetical protein